MPTSISAKKTAYISLRTSREIKEEIVQAAAYAEEGLPVVNSKHVQRKGSSGQIELYPADMANFWCPELDQSTQQSFTLKAQSECLLEAAKRAAEIAIEQDEAAGMAYLASEGALA
ncbi:MAG: hypothetical protein ABIW96_02480 [Polaromonas sp.]